MSPHSALISIKTYSSRAEALLKKSLSHLHKTFGISKMASVYSVKGRLSHSQDIHDLRSLEYFEGLSTVIEIRTDQRPQNLLNQLQQLEESLTEELLKRSVSINLLFYDSEVITTPQLSLPHPEAHRRPEELVPASEIWSGYVHPILGTSLSEITRNYRGEPWGDFYAQAKALLDF